MVRKISYISKESLPHADVNKRNSSKSNRLFSLGPRGCTTVRLTLEPNSVKLPQPRNNNVHWGNKPHKSAYGLLVNSCNSFLPKGLLRDRLVAMTSAKGRALDQQNGWSDRTMTVETPTTLSYSIQWHAHSQPMMDKLSNSLSGYMYRLVFQAYIY